MPEITKLINQQAIWLLPTSKAPSEVRKQDQGYKRAALTEGHVRNLEGSFMCQRGSL